VGSPRNAFLLFENNLPFMIEDYTRSGHDAEIAKNLALKCIQDSLKMNGRLLEDFNLPLPDFQMINQLVSNENSENSVITRQERRLMGERMVAQLNTSQREAFDQIMLSINAPSTNLIQPRTFFLDGPGGTGKTFLYNTLINVLQGQGKKVISVASTGIAATLLTNGATYHSKFQIYPPITETTTSRIEEHEYGAQLIRDASLIICDEASMMSRYAVKAIERILRKVMRNNSPYGRKVFLLGGDFRQCLPVVKHGNRVKVVEITIKTCEIWPRFNQLKLHENMRTVAGSQEHADWLIKLGNGTLPW
jgi:nucleoside-triphosphatase THEP1